MLTLKELNKLRSYSKDDVLAHIKARYESLSPIGKDGEAELFVLLPLLDSEFESKMLLFELYLLTTENFLETEVQRLEEELKRKEKDVNEPWIEILICREETRSQKEIINKFANILRKSFFISLYGFLESQLFQLCHSLKSYDEKNMPARPEKQRFKSKEAKPFLEKIKFPLDTGIWQDISDNYRRLRNCIIHHAGKPDGTREEKELREYICRVSTLSLRKEEDEDAEEIILEQGFCDEVLDTINKFFDRLLIALADWEITSLNTKLSKTNS